MFRSAIALCFSAQLTLSRSEIAGSPWVLSSLLLQKAASAISQYYIPLEVRGM